jgi:hypothetical protein
VPTALTLEAVVVTAVDVDAPPVPAALLVVLLALEAVVLPVVAPVVTLVVPAVALVALVLVAWLELTSVEAPCAGSVWDEPVSRVLSALEHPSPNENSSGVSVRAVLRMVMSTPIRMRRSLRFPKQHRTGRRSARSSRLDGNSLVWAHRISAASIVRLLRCGTKCDNAPTIDQRLRLGS